MVAGLQHDASVSKLKLLELERAVRNQNLHKFLKVPLRFHSLEHRSCKIPFQSAGRDLRGKLRKLGKPLPLVISTVIGYFFFVVVVVGSPFVLIAL